LAQGLIMANGNGRDLILGNLTERIEILAPWAKFRGKANLVPIDPAPGVPEAVVTRDAAGGFVVFVTKPALDEIRKDWPHARDLDSIPSDDEIAAWLTFVVLSDHAPR